MSRTWKRNRTKEAGTHKPPDDGGCRDQLASPEGAAPAGRDRKVLYLDLFTAVVLLGLGAYQSVRYFGYQAVPSPDFVCFADVSKQLLAGRLPTDMKRAPVLGFLHIGAAALVGGEYAELHGAWLVSAVLHPFNLVLIWLIARHLVGRSGVWIALLIGINPFVLSMLVQPLAETTLVFFCLLTFYLIFRRSSWAYLAGSVASMVRYEGAALLLAAWVVDMILRRGGRQRLWALLWAFLAILPLAAWMLATAITWQSQEARHYLKVIASQSDSGNISLEYLRCTWQVSILPLLAPEGNQRGQLAVLTQAASGLAFLLGLIWAGIKREWRILALMLFAVPYTVAHLLLGIIYFRFCMVCAWIVLIVCAYGLGGAWSLADITGRRARVIRTVFLALVGLVALFWTISLWSALPAYQRYDPSSQDMAAVALAAVVVLFAARLLARESRPVLQQVTVGLVVALMVVSSQGQLAAVMGHGKGDFEFKVLADWYAEHAKGGEVLVTTWAGNMPALLPERAKKRAAFIHSGEVPGQTLQDFIAECIARNVTYVAWDSRTGLQPDDTYYRLWRLQRIHPLGAPQSLPPFEFLDQIRVPVTGRYINIFRLAKPSPGPRISP